MEKNKDNLKNSNLNELWEQVQKAAQSGNTQDLEKFAKEKAGKASKSLGGGNLEQYFQMLPNGGEIGSKLQQLKDIGEKHGDKAQQLLQETFDEVKKVLEKKASEGQKIAEEAKKDAK